MSEKNPFEAYRDFMGLLGAKGQNKIAEMYPRGFRNGQELREVIQNDYMLITSPDYRKTVAGVIAGVEDDIANRINAFIVPEKGMRRHMSS